MLDLDFVLGGDEDFEDFVGLAEGGDTLAQGFGDAGFVAGIGVDDVPTALRRMLGIGVDDDVAGNNL